MDLHKVMHNWKKKNDAWFLLQIKKKEEKYGLQKYSAPPSQYFLG